MTDRATMMRILDLARWAPSGDNTQPWRFEVISPDHVVVRGFDTRDRCVFDLDGRASQLAIGALLETMHIAATGFAMRVECTRRTDACEERPTFDVRFLRDPSVQPSSLRPWIRRRSVNRRPLRVTPLSLTHKEKLEASARNAYRIRWFESLRERTAIVRITWGAAGVRLNMPEAFEVHRSVIQWGTRFSSDRIPDEAIGLDPLATRLMRWLMGDWRRVEIFNKYLAGTLVPRIELDLAPGLLCAGHMMLLAPEAPRTMDDYLAAGRAIQRIWLTATSLGLQHQPELAPLIFTRYVGEGRSFTRSRLAERRACELRNRMQALLGQSASERVVWMGRIGYGKEAQARSLRLSVRQLLARNSTTRVDR